MVNIELKGHLYWYANKKKTFSIGNFEGSLENLIMLLKLPQSEVGTLLVNQKKEPLSYIVKDNDHIILIPVVGGG
ncbi:MAG: hypothetical protein Q8S24_09455 [Eubacteriales bacterium]|nr:hypothetical protein [Eubacteriales bacterium]